MDLSHPWLDAELEYVRHLMAFILEEEVSATPMLREVVDGLLAKPGKMLRPRLLIIGARLAKEDGDDPYSLYPAPNPQFDDAVLARIKKGFEARLKQRQVPLKPDPDYLKWRNESPFQGGLPNSLYLLAAAVELLHWASLAHDDVIDEATIRRGRPSVPAQLGNSTAVLFGDLLFTLCFTLVNEGAEGPVAQMLSAMVRLMVRSELTQGSDRQKFDALVQGKDAAPSIRHYQRVIGGKTALLFAIALSAGAAAMEMEGQSLDRLQRCGFLLGMTFQMVDDHLDLWGSSSSTGKALGQDLIDGQVNLPILLILRANNRQLKELLVQIHHGEVDVTKLIAHPAMEAVEIQSRGEIDRWASRAKKELGQLHRMGCPGGTLSSLETILAFIVQRSH